VLEAYDEQLRYERSHQERSRNKDRLDLKRASMRELKRTADQIMEAGEALKKLVDDDEDETPLYKRLGKARQFIDDNCERLGPLKLGTVKAFSATRFSHGWSWTT
jgi:hypothetical protein